MDIDQLVQAPLVVLPGRVKLLSLRQNRLNLLLNFIQSMVSLAVSNDLAEQFLSRLNLRLEIVVLGVKKLSRSRVRDRSPRSLKKFATDCCLFERRHFPFH